MIGHLSTVAAISGGGTPIGNLPSTDLAIAEPAAPQASPVDAHSFSRAAGMLPEVQAPAPSVAQALGRDLAHRLEGLSNRLQENVQRVTASPANPDQAGAPVDPGASKGATDVVGDAVSQIQSVYAFAIETTLVSRGSTEATKIFNTLLKGQ